MTSPFPGMDPYLEAHGGDVQASLITYARDQIQSRLPRDLCARMQERLLVSLPEGEGRDVVPYVRVTERLRRGSNGGGVAVAEVEDVAELPLDPEDAEWADALLREKGLR